MPFQQPNTTVILPFDDYPPKDAHVGPDSSRDGGVECVQDATVSCYTGEASSLQGECREGEKGCDQFGHWGDCVGEVTPATQCANRECGSDGCGGRCRECESGVSCDEVTGFCLREDMATIDATQFWQGSPTEEPGRSSIDEQRHEVILTPYKIDRFEVTNQQYNQCVQAVLCEAPGLCEAGHRIWTVGGEYPQDLAEHPVVCVSWQMAADYCEFRQKRLCTEAEWERACVYSLPHRVFPWGETLPVGSQYLANCAAGYCDDAYTGTAEVGSFYQGRNTEAHLFDMAGNVAEWVSDWYSATYYLNAPLEDPKGPCDGLEPCTGSTQRVHRGGHFNSESKYLRCASRLFKSPTATPEYIGIRCCKDL